MKSDLKRNSSSSALRNKFAFSLIELLVTLGVIGCLAALVFPMFRNSMEAADRTACISNLRTLGHAAILYTVDHDGRFPATIVDYDVYWGYAGEPSALVKTPADQRPLTAYLSKSAIDVLHCPGDHGIFNNGQVSESPSCYKTLGTSYTFNGFNALYPSSGFGGLWNIPLSSVARPQTTLLFFERFLGVGSGTKNWHGAQFTPSPISFNAVFVDGHAETVKDTYFYNLGSYDKSKFQF